jgi:8-oxo-dGDP phosphatase
MTRERDRRPGDTSTDPGPETIVGSDTIVGPWRRRSRVVAYANPWIEVLHDEVDRPDGSQGIYGVVHFENAAVGVVAVDAGGRLLLVGQHRYALDEYSWEIPEGGVAPGEPLEAGARRELREETGYVADHWRQLCRLTLSNSVTDERGALFVADGLRVGAADPDPTEELALRWATLDEALAEIASGAIHDLLTIAGIGLYAAETLRAAPPPERRG